MFDQCGEDALVKFWEAVKSFITQGCIYPHIGKVNRVLNRGLVFGFSYACS